MSNDSATPITPYDFDSDPDGVRQEDFSDRDRLLELLLAVVPGETDSDNAVGITVVVNGAVVSGLAVSLAHWQQLWTTEIRAANKPLGDVFNTVMADWVTERADIVARREAEDRPTPGPSYLHLKDAHIVTGGFRQHLGLMRVRRARIDAWTLSQLTG